MSAGYREAKVVYVLHDLIELLMLWNGQASAGLDAKQLGALRDELMSNGSRVTLSGNAPADFGATKFHTILSGPLSDSEEFKKSAKRVLDDMRAEGHFEMCDKPPEGLSCTRGKGHEGPCAAVPARPEFPIEKRDAGPANITIVNDMQNVIDAVAHSLGQRAMGQIDGPVSAEDEGELKKFFDRFTFILDPVCRIDDLLREAKVAPRFRNSTYDAVDEIDATVFNGDEFEDPRMRQHFRYYLARWEKALRAKDELDKQMEGEGE
jgi:hypothetical protein